jgi:hypothetical protein
MLVPALRRFALLLVGIGGATALVSLLFGALIGASLARSLALGFYLVGCFLLLGGFFFGNRGPVRPHSAADAGGGLFFSRMASRRLRWATREEHEETINASAVFVTLGIALLVLGILSDNRHALF